MAAESLTSIDAPDVSAAVAAVLDRRLSASSRRPVAVALSGGGDSVALLLAARDWAQVHRRPLVALTVDHRLQTRSHAWTDACGELAARLGVGFRALAWAGDKPQRGLPAAARAARHRLLADAARDLGAQVILVGHTADDLAEARAMRQAGATTPEPPEWSPSPAWPEGRGVFLARPLLGLRRATLRDWLGARGEGWIEDPANADPRFARARARAALAGGGDAGPAARPPLALARACRFEPWGGITLARAAIIAAAEDEAARLLAIACVCAGGGARAPDAAARMRLAAKLCGNGPVVVTLAGARVEADADLVRIVREAGEFRRSNLQPLTLAPGDAAVWDGRFEVSAQSRGLTLRPLAGLARRLPADQQRSLAALPAAARPALPAVVDAEGGVSSPLLGGAEVLATSLVGERLRAAAGLVEREPDED